MTLNIEFLWYEDCPSHADAFRLLQDVLEETPVLWRTRRQLR